MKANSFKLRRDDCAAVSLGALLGIVILMFAIVALVGPIADETERADTNANVSNSAIAIFDLWPLFLALLALGAVAVVLQRAFGNA